MLNKFSMTGLVHPRLGPRRLDGTALGLAVHPLRLCRAAGPGLHALGLPDMGLGDQLRQPRPRILAIRLLGAVAAGGDDDLAGAVHAAAGQLLQATIGVGGRSELEDVAAKLDGGGDLVVILTAWAARRAEAPAHRLFRAREQHGRGSV